MNGSAVQRYIGPMVAGMQGLYNGSGAWMFKHADWQGSSRFDAYGGGAAYDRAYAPFGEVYEEAGGIIDRNFTGQTTDTVSGLYDFLFRQYSPVQGRWLVPDPAGLAAVDITNPQTWNRYAYLANNPLNATDPLGLYCAIGVDGGIIGGCTEGDIWIGGTFFPWWWGGSSGAGGGGGGHTNPPPGNPPPSPPPPSPPPQPVSFPNETLGIPNGLNLNWGGIWGAIIPTAICGDMGPCNPIGSGYLDGVSGNGSPESPWTFYAVVLASFLQNTLGSSPSGTRTPLPLPGKTPQQCDIYGNCGRGDLQFICSKLTADGPISNCIRECLQGEFSCGTKNYPQDPVWKTFGPVVHYNCFKACGWVGVP